MCRGIWVKFYPSYFADLTIVILMDKNCQFPPNIYESNLLQLCKIFQIRQGAFAGLHSLDRLDLRHNSLERLGAEVFTGIKGDDTIWGVVVDDDDATND